MSKLNENILYNSLSFLPFDILLDGLIDIGYENDIRVLGNDKSVIQGKWVDECRQIGIETFVQRISSQDTIETCSLLSLSSVNESDDENAMIQASRVALEQHMKKDSLDNYFYSLTPHILYQYCKSLLISLPPPTTSAEEAAALNTPSPSNSDSEQEERDNKKIMTKDESKTIVSSQPLIQVDNDGTTIISTVSTKSFYQKYSKGRGLQYGDSIIEGQFYESIIGLLKDEILLSGTENLLSLFNSKLLKSISNTFKIDNNNNNNSNNDKDQMIQKIVVLLFNLKQFNNSPDLNNSDHFREEEKQAVQSLSSSEEEEEEEEEDEIQVNNNNINNNNSLKRKIMDYPQSPSSPSDFYESNDEKSDNDGDDRKVDETDDDQENDSEDEQDEEKEEEKRLKKKSKSNDNNDDDGDQDIQDVPYIEEIEEESTQIESYQLKQKQKVRETETINIDDDDDEDIKKTKTPTTSIYKGMNRKELETMLNIDLLQWLENNNIPTEKRQSKDKLIDKIISVLNGNKD
ncbi:hypothetical protein CYY_007600 [Polysphondylium violaceum]|uniref:SAP DNA-binding domain-containing protein n=1 Tax=Polysphondylium violaceum TaxID=133409 RepID=A0A8J4PPF1_9MYCE|nr:hypothetical protein CYY_007600 [Polysphondylium violaceum]